MISSVKICNLTSPYAKRLLIFAYLLQVLSNDIGGPWEECLVHIKMASVQFCLSDYPTVAEHIIQAVLCLDQSMPDAPEDQLEDKRKLSQVY